MNPGRRFERDLDSLLTDLAMPAVPFYRDDIVQQVARTRQRPAWTFPGRWLPMDLTYARSGLLPHGWRPVVGALLILALLVAVAVAAGVGVSRPLPPPYGPAGNGWIVYDKYGDIYLGNPVAGSSDPLITGPEIDRLPNYAKTGSMIVFLRQSPGGELLMAAKSDGTGIRALASTPFADIIGGDLSGDGRTLLIVSKVDGRHQMSLTDMATGTVRALGVGSQIVNAVFLPPDDTKILFVEKSGGATATYVVSTSGDDLRRVTGYGSINVSPDGRRLAYAATDATQEYADRLRVHVVGIDGTNDIVIDNPAGVRYQGTPTWSPDGTRLFVARAYANGSLRLAIVPASGVGPEVELPYPVNGGFGSLGWSPDGTKVVFSPADEAYETAIFEVADGSFRVVPRWYTASWQRLAP